MCENRNVEAVLRLEMKDVREKIGVLTSFSDLDEKSLREHCELLGNTQ